MSGIRARVQGAMTSRRYQVGPSRESKSSNKIKEPLKMDEKRVQQAHRGKFTPSDEAAIEIMSRLLAHGGQQGLGAIVVHLHEGVHVGQKLPRDSRSKAP